jgi:hypothetical protein
MMSSGIKPTTFQLVASHTFYYHLNTNCINVCEGVQNKNSKEGEVVRSKKEDGRGKRQKK